MNTESIVVHVNPDVAAAYRDASSEDRRRFDLLVSLRLTKVLKSDKPFSDERATTETIILHVNPQVAAAYRNTSGRERQKLDLLVSVYLAELLGQGKSLEDMMGEMAKEATASGLTPEILDAILHDEGANAHESATTPVSLRVVAVFFMLSGAFCVLDVVVALAHKHVNINFGVLGLLIGPGLLHLRRGWRTCALVLLWIAILLFPLAIILVSFAFTSASRLADATHFGQWLGLGEVALISVVVGYALVFWSYHVLTRPDIRKLFGITAD